MMTAKEFRQSENFTIRVTPRGTADKRDVDAFAYEYSQYVIKALKINAALGSVSDCDHKEAEYLVRAFRCKGCGKILEPLS